MIRLRTLGGVALEQDGRQSVATGAQRKAMALLVVLGSAGDRGISRDRLLALLWPDSPADRARNALNQTLHAIRRAIGADHAILGIAELRLNPEAITVDIRQFDEALRSSDLDLAISLYTGPFLDGFFVRDALEFEHWAEVERARLAEQFALALERLARKAAEHGAHPRAVPHWRRLAGADPLNSRYAMGLMEALAASGDPGGALQVAQTHTALVREELDAVPDPAVAALAKSLRLGERPHAPLAAPQLLSRPPAAATEAPAEGRLRDPPPLPAGPAGVPASVAPRGARRGPMRVALLGLGFLVGVGVLFASRHRRSDATPATATAGPVRLAVLPFDDEGDTANAYFARGITDEIRGKLAALAGLRLIASTSSNQYQHTHKPAEQIGRELGVRYLLMGRVQWEQSANGTKRVRVSPELVEVPDGAAPETRWQQSYDTTLDDVFDVQAAVATRVADKLGVVLSPPARTQLAARPTQNLAAYDAYLRSTALVGVDPPTLRRALAAAEQAVALDSTFAAAWARVSTRHRALYLSSIPTPADADAARRAAERAVALAPTAPQGYIARGVYNLSIAHDLPAARAAFETALRLAPSSAEANSQLAFAEAAVGQWTTALGHARQAAALDPRSALAAWVLSRVLLWLRHYPEARAEAERGLTIAPADLYLTETRAMSRLGEGDLAGARAGLRDIPPTLDRATLAAYIAYFWDLYWALDSADRALVLTLPPSAFDDDRGTWGLMRAELYWLAGDTVHASRYADTARLAFETQLRATPDDNVRHLYHGLALAYLGRRAAAVREGEHGLALAQATGDGYFIIPWARHVLARLYVAVGDHPHALDQLDSLLARPDYISPAWLRIDPTWAPLKGDPRFGRLLTQPPARAAPTT